MEIILVSKHASGQAALPAKRIGGHLAPERHYHIVDHKVILSGHPDKVLKADAQELLTMPDNLYRMPIPTEQESWAKAEQEASQISEQGEQDDFSDLEDEEELAQDDQDIEEDLEQKEEEPAPTVPPALQEKPKRHYNRKK